MKLAHGETIANVRKMLDDFMPGDSHSNLQFDTKVAREVIDLVLFPVWSFAVRYDPEKPPLQILVNGQTGRVGGKVPISVVKVTLAVLIVIGLIGILFVAFGLAH